MAGLQQYNFFPTDLFYPRPKPQPSSSAKPTVLPLQTPNTEDQNQPQQPPRSVVKATPSTTSPLVYTQKRQSLSGVDNKVSKFSTNPLSLVVWMDEEEGDDTF